MLLEFSSAEVEETREINENVYVDFDKASNLVSMTIEHAATLASLPLVHIEEIDASAAQAHVGIASGHSTVSWRSNAKASNVLVRVSRVGRDRAVVAARATSAT